MSMTYDGTNGITFPDSSIQKTAGYSPFRNRIINGSMVVDQRNAGASVTATTTGGSGAYTLDRWKYFTTQASKFTVQQNAGSVTPPVGFKNYLGVTSSSAYSVVSSDVIIIQHVIEGLNVADLAWGTANASSVTLSFKVYSSLTGTFGGSLQNADGSRSYPFTYTISSANTWTTISLTIAGDTTGTWLTTNGAGIQIGFGLGVGSTYLGTAGSWVGANYNSATGATNVVATSGATFYITGVQLEKGSVATPFEVRPYGTELTLCQRYYEKLVWAQGTNVMNLMHNSSNTSQTLGTFAFAVTKRATPTTITSATSTFMAGNLGGSWSVTSILLSGGCLTSGSVGFGLSSSPGTTSSYVYVPTGPSATFEANSEL